ncbi:GDSL esterase/lipase At1g29670 [Linum grandiflorum]
MAASKWTIMVAVALVLSCFDMLAIVDAQPQVPGFFIFGDSLVDNGNNNRLQSLARADYMPYGIDFPGGPTGRFCNGKTTVDVIAQQLGFNFIPPYVTASGRAVLGGVNYASAAAGIREETGQQLGGRISFSGQVRNYQNTAAQIAAAATHLSRCIFSIGLGSNDYLNNYFMPAFYSTGRQFTPDQYADDLIRRYTQQLQILYEYGARKFAVAGIGKLGCIPYTMNLFGTNGAKCIDKVNAASQYFNKEAKRLVIKLNAEFKGDAKLIYINSYGMGDGDPTLLAGFKNVVSGCCQSREDGQCVADQAPCENRAEYVFWDSFHPTEAANKATAARTYKSFTPSDCDPFDIHTLANFNVGKHK